MAISAQSGEQRIRERSVARSPKFGERSSLCLFVHEDQRMSGSRPSSAAFIKAPDDDHLSVNSLELESLAIIADYYRQVLQEDASVGVAIAVNNVASYNLSGRSAGVSIMYDETSESWQFAVADDGGDAYKHRPVRKTPARLGSPSHCGVEFVRALDDLGERKFARRMARNKYHVC